MNKSVPPTIYTRDYYLSDCTGYEEYLRSKGQELDQRLRRIIPLLSITPKQTLLDVGCGRGEIVFFAARNGVDATGIDYAKAAVDLSLEAQETQEKKIRKLSHFEVMNAKKMSFGDNAFDWVVMTDVVEHMYADELEQVYREVFRVLKPGGKLLIHTEPNKIYNDFTYPFYCYPLSRILVWINQLITGNKYPDLPHPSLLRTESHKEMHVNEATYYHLQSQLTDAGFAPLIKTQVTILKPTISWKDTLFNMVVCWHPLSRFWPFNIFFSNDFVVIARKR